jgi:hypothetical protein
VVDVVTLKRVGINSAFKIGAMIGLITSLISGVLLVGMQALFVSAFAGLIATSMDAGEFSSINPNELNFMTTFGLAGLCIFFLVYIVFSTIAGGIGGVIWAFAYNLGARWVGGLELELETEPGKRKRSAATDDIYE